MYRTMESKNYATAEAAIKDLKDGYRAKLSLLRLSNDTLFSSLDISKHLSGILQDLSMKLHRIVIW